LQRPFIVRAALFLFISTSLSAQFVSVGVKGGVPLSPTLDGRMADSTGILGKCGECASGRTLPYVVGPALEVHLNRQWSLSAEALYGRADYDHTSTTFFTPASGSFNDEKHTVDRWEFPVLLKFSLKGWHTVNPFVAAGVSLQYDQDSTQMRLSGAVSPPLAFVRPGLQTDLGVPAASTGLGSTFAVGASFGTGRVRPSLEYRYTHWADQLIVVNHIDAALLPGAGTPTLHASQNQSQLLAGLMLDFDSDGSRSGDAPPKITAPRFLVGLKGGFPLTNAFGLRPPVAPIVDVFNRCGECATQRTLPYVIAPAVEIRLVRLYSVSAEAVYTRADYNHTSSSFSTSSTSLLLDTKDTVDRWEFPFLLKMEVGARRRFHPFVGVGATVQYARDSRARTIVATKGFGGSVVYMPPGPVMPTVASTVAGPTAAVGTAFGAGRLRPSIEFRYTRWFEQAIAVSIFGSAPSRFGPATVYSAQNQSQILVGVMF
jgi:hypothetical protein